MATAVEIVEKAESYVGYLEKASNSSLDSFTENVGSNNYTMFGRDYDSYVGVNLNGQAWCAIFVSCMGIYLGMNDSEFYKFAYCPYGVTWFKNKNRYYTSPQAGDIIFFNDMSGVACHTGIVSKVSGGYVYTVEGNTSSAAGVVTNGGAVAKKSYALTNSRIMGYGRPNYKEEEEEVTQDQFNSMMENYLSQKNADTTVSGWAKTAWANCKAAGVMDGTMPQGNVTREQLATILNKQGVNAFKLYANVSDCPDWMQGTVQDMIDAGFISGDGVNTVGKTHLQLEVMIVAYKMYLDAVAKVGGVK